MSRAQLLDVMRRHGIRAGRRLGQHFLFDPGLLDRIVGAAQIAPGDAVLEVGPGLGVLTRRLLGTGATVVAAEIDRGLRPALLDVLAEFGSARPDPERWLEQLAADALGPRLRLVWADAVRLPWSSLAEWHPGPWCLCSNLPYYVTGPFVAAFLRGGLPWRTAVMLVQEEAAARMLAGPGGKTYGAFSCLVQYHAQPTRLFPVPRAAFVPPPSVNSVVIRLSRRHAPPTDVPPEPLMRVVRAAFGQRRKTLRNALSGGLDVRAAFVERALELAGVDPGRRAETLTLAEFGRLTTALGPDARPPDAR